MPFSASDPRVKAYPKEAREIWARAANAHLKRHPGEDASAIRIGWTAVRAAGYAKDGKESHKWVHDGLRSPSELAKWNTWDPFTYGMTMTKASKEDEDPWIEGIISGNAVDRQDEQMELSALKSIVKQLNAGSVLLLPSHSDTFECGRSLEGSLLKNGEPWDGDEKGYEEGDNVEVLARFSLDKEHHLYPQIRRDWQNKQFSVGGAVVSAFKEYNSKLGGFVRKLRDVFLEHTAMTREKQAAYAPSKMTAAMVKSVDWEAIEAVPGSEEGGDSMTIREAIDALKTAVQNLQKAAQGDQSLTMKDMVSDGKGGFTLSKEAQQRSATKATAEERREVSDEVVKALGAVGIAPVTEAPKVVVLGKSAPAAPAAPTAPGQTPAEAVAALAKELTAGMEKKVQELTKELEKAQADSAEAKLLKQNVENLKKEIDNLKSKTAATPRPDPAKPVVKEFSESQVPAAVSGDGIYEKAMARIAELKVEIEQGAAMLKSGQIAADSKEHNDLRRKSEIKMELQANPVHAFKKHFSAELQKA